MRGGPICIITASGMICETLSYEGPTYDDAKGQWKGKGKVPSTFDWQKATMGDRVAELMKQARVANGPFMIIPRP